MTCGLYKLYFNNADKVYIGQSRNIEARFLSHISSMRNNKSSAKLQSAFNTYGEPFLEILIECDSSELDALEDEAIEIYNSVDNGFNTLYSSRDTPKNTNIGEANSFCKYSNKQIIDTFILVVESTLTYREIERMTGITNYSIRAMVNGHNYSWLQYLYPEEYNSMIINKGNRNITKTGNYGNNKYSREQLLKVLDMLIEKVPRKTIEQLTGIPYKTISNIPSGAYPWMKELYPDKFNALLSIKQKYNIK